jgi:hypothetical protein
LEGVLQVRIRYRHDKKDGKKAPIKEQELETKKPGMDLLGQTVFFNSKEARLFFLQQDI